MTGLRDLVLALIVPLSKIVYHRRELDPYVCRRQAGGVWDVRLCLNAEMFVLLHQKC